MKKIAAIDLGSNSVRLMLAQIQDGMLHSVEKYLEMTRLGSKVDSTKMLQEENITLTKAAIRNFKERAVSEGYMLIGGFATSAVREALNGKAFAESVFEETGVPVTIVGGEEEAVLGYLGVLSGLPRAWADEGFAIVDIGGGSTEILSGKGKRQQWGHSFDLGAVRMTGKHLMHLPPQEIEVLNLIGDIGRILDQKAASLSSLAPVRLIGIGGTATTFAAMALEMEVYDRQRIQNAYVSYSELKAMVDQLRRMSLEERQQLKGLQPKRADIIFAGGVILLEVMSRLGAEGFYASDSDNLEGLLVQRNYL